MQIFNTSYEEGIRTTRVSSVYDMRTCEQENPKGLDTRFILAKLTMMDGSQTLHVTYRAFERRVWRDWQAGAFWQQRPAVVEGRAGLYTRADNERAGMNFMTDGGGGKFLISL